MIDYTFILTAVSGAVVFAAGYTVGSTAGRGESDKLTAQRDLERRQNGKLSNRIGRQRVKIGELKKAILSLMPQETKEERKARYTGKASMLPSSRPSLPH